jgi:hypothetical protein
MPFVTSNVILYNRGVPPNARNFAMIARLNYSVLKLVSIYNKKQGNSNYLLF